MRFRVALSGLIVLVALNSTRAGDDKTRTILDTFKIRVDRKDFAGDKLRREVLEFARSNVGTLHHGKAIELLQQIPSPFDRLDASGIAQTDVKLTEIPELIALVRSHGRAVAHVAISSDANYLATSGWDNHVHLFKLGSKTPISWAKLEGSLSGVAFSPDSRLLATGSPGTEVLVWDITGKAPKEEFRLLGHKNRPFAVAFGPRGRILASGCSNPVLRIRGLEDLNPEVLGVLSDDDTTARGIASLAYTHDGKYLCAGCLFGRESLRIWNTSGPEIFERPIPITQARLVACSPASPLLAFAGDGAEIHLWNVGSDKIEAVRRLPGHPGKSPFPLVTALAFSPDGKHLASSGQDQRICLWNVSAGTKEREFRLPDEPRAIAFSSDGRHIAIGSSEGLLYVLRLAKAPGVTK